MKSLDSNQLAIYTLVDKESEDMGSKLAFSTNMLDLTREIV
jgi:hypothetical protein